MRKKPPFYSLRTRLVSVYLCVTLALCVITTAYSEQLKKGMVPVAPELLFKALPKSAEGWKLKQSRGRSGIGIWLESEVLREFERDIQQKGKKQEEPAATKIIIKDTAKAKGGELDLFDDFKPEKFPEEGYEYLYLGGVPAILANYKNKEIEAQFLIKDRFILTIIMRGQSSKKLKNWFKRVKFSVLLAIPEGPKVYLPNEVAVIKIDELDPSKSSSYGSSASIAETPGEEDDVSNVDSINNK